MDLNQINLYFNTYKKLNQSLRFGTSMCNEAWLELLPTGPSVDWGIETLPILLALIHPHFCIDRHGQQVVVDEFSKKSFKHDGSESCKIRTLLPGVSCPYHSVFEKSHADHLWPHSLGGLTTPGNKLALCQVCNRAKSNSPFLYPGENIARWLRLHVINLARKKSPGMSYS